MTIFSPRHLGGLPTLPADEWFKQVSSANCSHKTNPGTQGGPQVGPVLDNVHKVGESPCIIARWRHKRPGLVSSLSITKTRVLPSIGIHQIDRRSPRLDKRHAALGSVYIPFTSLY